MPPSFPNLGFLSFRSGPVQFGAEVVGDEGLEVGERGGLVGGDDLPVLEQVLVVPKKRLGEFYL